MQYVHCFEMLLIFKSFFVDFNRLNDVHAYYFLLVQLDEEVFQISSKSQVYMCTNNNCQIYVYH